MLTQEKDIANPQLRQEIDAFVKEFDQAKTTTMPSPWPRSSPTTRFL